MSNCPGLLTANRHGCVAGWITRWPFHLRNHNLNPAGSHQRINGQRHSYFKVTKHYKKGKGGTFIFLNHGFGHRFNWLPWLCYYTLEPGSRTDKLSALALPISESGTGLPLLQERRSLTSQCVEQQQPCCGESDGWLNGTCSAWTQAAGRDDSADTRGS